ncbi:MAG: hypothetical protein HUJ61_03970, partial [Bacilli bacterium]|nr:hypothetical protein [Bacilli bacterium]
MNYKKPFNATLILYLIMFAILFFLGREILTMGARVIENNVTFVIITFICGFIGNAILYEIGHVIGAKIGGYNIISFNILGVEFAVIDHKLTLRTGPYDGLTGDVKIVENPNCKKRNPKAFLRGGLVVIFLEIVASLIVAVIVIQNDNNASLLESVVMFVGTIGLIIFFYNIAPCRLDTNTDGQRIGLINKNKDEFEKLISIQTLLYENKKLENIEAVDKQNSITDLYNYYSYLSKIYTGKYDEANSIIDKLIENSDKLSIDVYKDLLPAKVYLAIKSKTKDEAISFIDKLTDSQKSSLSRCDSLEGWRCYIALQG